MHIIINTIAVLGIRRGAPRFRTWKLRRCARRSRRVVRIAEAQWRSRSPPRSTGRRCLRCRRHWHYRHLLQDRQWRRKIGEAPLAVSAAFVVLTWLTNDTNPAPCCVVSEILCSSAIMMPCVPFEIWLKVFCVCSCRCSVFCSSAVSLAVRAMVAVSVVTTKAPNDL